MPVELEMAQPEEALFSNNSRLVDVVDGLLHHGVVLKGELWLSVAEVDLVYLGLDLVLTSPDRIKCAAVVPHET